MSLGFSGKSLDYQDVTIANTAVPFWPDLNLGEFQKQRAIPPHMDGATAVQALLAAVGEVNKSLAGYVEQQQAKGYDAALDVPGATVDGENQLTAQYKKAVYARTKADLLGEFASIGRRETHPGQESNETRESLIAESTLVIRNIKGKSRVGVSLI